MHKQIAVQLLQSVCLGGSLVIHNNSKDLDSLLSWTK